MYAKRKSELVEEELDVVKKDKKMVNCFLYQKEKFIHANAW